MQVVGERDFGSVWITQTYHWEGYSGYNRRFKQTQTLASRIYRNMDFSSAFKRLHPNMVSQPGENLGHCVLS